MATGITGATNGRPAKFLPHGDRAGRQMEIVLDEPGGERPANERHSKRSIEISFSWV